MNFPTPHDNRPVLTGDYMYSEQDYLSYQHELDARVARKLLNIMDLVQG